MSANADTFARDLSWPFSRSGEAIEAIARRAKLFPLDVEIPIPPAGIACNPAKSGRWIEDAAARLGVEAEPAEAPYPEAERLLRGAAPALLRLPGAGEARFLALAGRRRSDLLLLGPDGELHRVPLDGIRHLLCREIEAPIEGEIDRLLRGARVADRRIPGAARAMLRERLSYARVSGCWLLRSAPGRGFASLLRQSGLPGRAAWLALVHLAQYVLWLGAWWLIGQGALRGTLDAGWLAGWGLMLLTIVPLRMLETWLQGSIAITGGALLKQRLLQGALNLDPEEIKHLGTGGLLGQVIESESVETLALGGGLLGGMSLIEILLAALVLSRGAGGLLQIVLLVIWLAVTVAMGLRYYRLRAGWTEGRLEITHNLVERMIGHRTRLAQESPGSWHRAEDREIERYADRSGTMDRSGALLEGLVPRGWLLLGLLGIAPAFVAHASVESLAVAVGGVLLAYAAFAKLAGGAISLAGAAIAWRQVSFLFHAASRQTTGGPAWGIPEPEASGTPEGDVEGSPLIEAHDLVFRYREGGDPVLRGCTMVIRTGERILLEGASGGGKSTLASVLIGLRQQGSGLLLLRGFDLRALGSTGWRRRVVAAPQFHENHVLMGTLAFNLLMGGNWPPGPEDFEEAEGICRELGLGELLERMPAGLLQNVGETGWQLSHGERSRLYIARALLQRAELIVLDESFGALDPETLQLALRCVFRRAPALLVIAHP